jgi:hypothetical protein
MDVGGRREDVVGRGYHSRAVADSYTTIFIITRNYKRVRVHTPKTPLGVKI